MSISLRRWTLYSHRYSHSVLMLCPQPSAWTQIKKMKHWYHRGTRIGLHGSIFFEIFRQWYLDYGFGFSRIWSTMVLAFSNHFSPLSFSPVGEMQVSPNCQRLVDISYSELSKIGWFRLRTCWCWLLLLMCQAFHFIGIFVQFWASSVPTWGKHVAQHGKARCPTWARLLHGCCPFVPNMADSVRA